MNAVTGDLNCCLSSATCSAPLTVRFTLMEGIKVTDDDSHVYKFIQFFGQELLRLQ
jgi:hypothetical protein